MINSSENRLDGLTIVLDCAFGASHRIAPEVFRALGANVIATNCMEDGKKINENCGAVHPQALAKKVLRFKADAGFAFDGDADRLIAVDEKGHIIDGDMIIYGLAKFYKKLGKLKKDTVVGTSHTNMAIEAALKREGLELIRTDIGDKYVLQKLLENDLSLGGEQSGHIILKDIATTGDGILSAIAVANMILQEKTTFSKALDVELYPQSNKNVVVSDKFRVMNSEVLRNLIAKYRIELGDSGRIMIRASGTEPKIRVMVESQNEALNEKIADDLVETVKNISNEN